MVKIDKVSWAKVKIGGEDYWQVLLIADQIIPRKVEAIKEKYGTDHFVSSEEQKLLLSKSPEVILIASGWSGVLKVDPKFKDQISKLGIKLKVVLTPRVVRQYNQLVEKGKRVNALIHTTC
jgi:hypothetical protein